MNSELPEALPDYLKDYAGAFYDGTPRGWDISRNGPNWNIHFPNGAVVSSLELLDSKVWGQMPESDANTTVLWRNSLAYLPRILNYDDGDETSLLVIRILESFLEWFTESIRDDVNKLKSGSLDHQSALRIRSTLHVLSLFRRSGDEDKFTNAYNLYRRLLDKETQILDSLELYQPNNHGIMLGIAHLHACTITPEVANLGAGVKWLHKLYGSLSDIIDEDGIASENTPIYQVFYVALLEDITAFLAWAGSFHNQRRKFQLLLRASQIGVRRQLMPDGAVPPIGDSPGGMQYKFKPMLGELWSPKNGISVCSNHETYVSFIAGFRSVIHKQLDDLSVTWWRKGKFILRDAGLLSYDANDKIALAMRGPRGHSSPGYKNLDGWTPKDSVSFGRNESRLRGHLISTATDSSGSTQVGELDFDGNTIVRRSMHLSSNGNMSITDHFLSTKHGAPLTRFLLDPSVVVKPEADGTILLMNHDCPVRLSFMSSGTFGFDINDSFIALEHHKKTKTKEIVITPLFNGIDRTLISVFTLTEI